MWLVSTTLANAVLELPTEELTIKHSGCWSQISNSIYKAYTSKEENLKRGRWHTTLSSLIVLMVIIFVLFPFYICESYSEVVLNQR